MSGSYFHVFGLGAFAGRVINNSDDQQSAAPVAMISYRTWQQAYGSDPGIVGSTFFVQGQPVTLIGITPPGFFGETLRSDPPDFWLPLQQEILFDGQNAHMRTNQSPVAVCHWQVEAGCERASTSRPADAGAATLAP